MGVKVGGVGCLGGGAVRMNPLRIQIQEGWGVEGVLLGGRSIGVCSGDNRSLGVAVGNEGSCQQVLEGIV